MKTLFLFIGLIAVATLAEAQSTVNYSNDDSNFANPERGFYHHTETRSGNYNLLDAGSLSAYRTSGISLILRVFYLDDFKESPISSEYLSKMSLDFQIARQAGVKVIIRFAYTKKSSKPYGDASLEHNLVHLEQLKPILHGNEDVIAFVQAGFIGAWGEWYYTDHYSTQLGFPNAEDWIKRRQLVKGILEAVPSTKMVQLRTPQIKFKILDDETALLDEEAFTATDKARLGHHNDCFLASSNDVGTYNDIDKEKAYLEEETRFVVMGGETCGVAEPYSLCPNAVSELERFHYTYLNIDYHPQVLNSWSEDGCFIEIERSLGYRYRLTSSTITDLSKPNGEFNLSLLINNDGWANNYTKRTVQIVLKNKDNGEEYFYNTLEDPRFWSLVETTSIELSIGIPSTIKSGNYSVYLNIPDPAITISNDPNYSIRMANTNVWDDETGYNNLGITLNIDPSNVTPTYNGVELFSKRVSLDSFEKTAIIIDGNMSEWASLPILSSAENNTNLTTLKLYNESDSLYIGLAGTNLIAQTQLFIDTDNSISTGYNAWQWEANGADLLIENGILYTYNGTGQAWGWQEVRSINTAGTSSAQEFSIGLTELNESLLIGIAVVNDPNGVMESNYIPYQNEAFLEYNLFLPLNTELLSGQDQDRILLFWGKDDASVLRYVERSINTEPYELIATLAGDVEYYFDFNIDQENDFNYRFFKIANGSKSTYSNSVTNALSNESRRYYEIVADGIPDDWYALPPLSTRVSQSNYTLRTFWGTQQISFIITGEDVSEAHIYLDIDNTTTTGGESSFDASPGYEYYISNTTLFHFNGNEWEEVEVDITVSTASHITELSLPIESLAELANNQEISISTNLISNNGLIALPETGKTIVYNRRLGTIIPADFAVKKSGDFPKERLVMTWNICENCNGYILDRSTDGTNFIEIAELPSTSKSYFDNGLEDETTYHYRIYSYNEVGPSDYSNIMTESTGAVLTGFEDAQFEKAGIFPNPVENTLNLLINESTGTIHIQILTLNGTQVIYETLNSNNGAASINVSQLKKGIYIVIVKNETHSYYSKFIRD